MDEPTPTYAELVIQRAEEWRIVQATAAKNLADLHAQIAHMPDVVNAPSPEVRWSHADIVCMTCACSEFHVERWNTLNGHRHRAELRCARCAHVGTWDWGMTSWV